jgi:hypothetical protein
VPIEVIGCLDRSVPEALRDHLGILPGFPAPRLGRLHKYRSPPVMIWGRDELRLGEMWNSNSVISYLLARSGLHTESIRPPAGGRAPGWDAGIVAARRMEQTEEPQTAPRA